MILLTEEAKNQFEKIVLGYNYPNFIKRLYITNDPSRYKIISKVVGKVGDYTIGVITHKRDPSRELRNFLDAHEV